jgi:hypothetical protein
MQDMPRRAIAAFAAIVSRPTRSRMTPPTNDSPPRPTSGPGKADTTHTRTLAREFFASALYVAIVLLTALVALPKDRLPSDISIVGTLFGTAVGLIVAHFVAFRLAAHFTAESGIAPAPITQEAGAGLAGGLLVATIAAIPYALWDADDALLATLITLAFLPAFMGMAIARLRGRSWTKSLLAAAITLVIAIFVVLIKYELGH